ncbi:MAG: hypothetical protein NWF02_05330 [Candidatus Bathyarchaeota archaeon]|nr:hypothetical protein [Candidatus Bathyarchaeum sp.]
MKTKRLALLCLLLIASASTAVVAQGAGLMQGFRSADMTEIKVNSASVSLILTAEDRQKVIDLVLMDSQIQQLLASADNYTIEVSEIFDINQVSFDLDASGDGIALVPREGIAQAIITINNDYGDEFGVQVITVTVNLETEQITETDVQPETIRPKIEDGIVSITDLVENASKYDGVVVTVSGEVSLLGEVFGSLFELDGIVTVFYAHAAGVVDVSNISNGDTVTVTGSFVAPDTIYATAIELN